jgi:hypothetical protein
MGRASRGNCVGVGVRSAAATDPAAHATHSIAIANPENILI